MSKKYFAWSFDDGLEQDKKIIAILKEYKMGATFHLNSGLFGDKTYEGRIGNLGMTEKPAAAFDPKKKHLLPYVPHFRIPADEVRDVYAGFEIASHTCNHVNLMRCPQEALEKEITGDVQALSSLFGQPVTGFAYPYGMGAKQARDALRHAGVQYARLATSAQSFRFPKDPLAMPLSCWHISPKTFRRLDDFFRMDPAGEDCFFLMFAHGYESDFGTKQSNWDKFKRICETVASHDGVVCCSIEEAFRRHREG